MLSGEVVLLGLGSRAVPLGLWRHARAGQPLDLDQLARGLPTLGQYPPHAAQADAVALGELPAAPKSPLRSRPTQTSRTLSCLPLPQEEACNASGATIVACVCAVAG